MVQTLHAIFFHGDDQEREDYTPSGAAVANGDIVAIGGGVAAVGQVGVVTTPGGIADGTLGSVAKKGVFKVKKLAADSITFAQGSVVFWDTVNKKAVIATAANCVRLGLCRDRAAAATDDHVVCGINEYTLQ